VDKNPIKIKISKEEIDKLQVGAKDLKIFAISNSVLKPDYYSTSLLVMENEGILPEIKQNEAEFSKNNSFEWMWPIIITAIISITAIYIKKRKIINR
jgi:peptide/nickel transport system substrate-binding protein